jgi:hypothetical protein
MIAPLDDKQIALYLHCVVVLRGIDIRTVRYSL